MEDEQQGIKGGIVKISRGFSLALIVIFIVTFVVMGFSRENKKESTPQEKIITEQRKPGEKDLKPQEEKKPGEKKSTPSEEAREKYDEAELLRESQRNLDRSLSTLNTVATLMGVLVGLLTVIIIIAIAFGFLEFRKWIAARRRVERSAKIIEDIQNKAEEYLVKLGEKIEEVSSRSLVEMPSLELKETLDEYNRRLRFVEIFGLPLKSRDYIIRGYNLINKKKYEIALEAFEKAISLESNAFKAWLGKGFVFDIQGRNHEALKISDKLIALDPEESIGWSNKGASLIKLKRYEEALISVEKAINLSPNYAGAWRIKGSALLGLKRYDESLKAYDKAIALKPDIAITWYNKGGTLYELGRYDEAIEAYDESIKLNPDDADTLYYRALSYSTKGDKEKALEDLTRAVELDPKLKEEAKKDEDFKDYWEDEDFKRITS